MISIHIYRNTNNNIYGFLAKNHGLDIVCSAVSILTFNAINSIEAFTSISNKDFICKYKKKGGLLNFEIPTIKNGNENRDVNLLLNSMLLGLRDIQTEYGKYIQIFDKEVQQNVKN